MFKKLFKRNSPKPPKPEPETPASQPVVAPKGSTLEAFKEQWEDHWEARPPEVVEGNGGHTDWGLWTDAVKKQDEANAFAPTVPMPLDPK